ncbi:hypothetical protein OS493_027079 [Desmophyllum pertusum]|uniref:Uncharacterized protein n=1 Tax=Desmophyllum pertusum TaxID=174260 RepID=A0A9W9Y9I1_9CNID|nr:hypothetical protein OS493_027079 [Desmophyllum pertusum]
MVGMVLCSFIIIIVFWLRYRILRKLPRKCNSGLDLPIKDLTIDGNNFLAQRLNGKGNYGYFYWQMIAEKLDLFEECRAWEGAENPTKRLLTAYGEKEGSTIRSLIVAVREAELTYFANEIEQRFSITRVQGAHELGHIIGTDV